MRRTTCTVLALALAAASGIGCGSDDDDTDSGGAGTGASGSGASGNGGSGATGASGSGAAGASGGAGSGGEASGGAGGGSASGGAGGAGGGADADAQANIMGEGISGTAVFTVSGSDVTLTVNVNGAQDGLHGFHIHQVPACTPDFMAAGGHWNPENNEHGAFDQGGHLGDVGNIDIAGGSGTLSVTTDLWTVGGGGDTDVIGHSVMLHAGEDTQMPNSDPGGRIACGVIQAAN